MFIVFWVSVTIYGNLAYPLHPTHQLRFTKYDAYQFISFPNGLDDVTMLNYKFKFRQLDNCHLQTAPLNTYISIKIRINLDRNVSVLQCTNKQVSLLLVVRQIGKIILQCVLMINYNTLM